MDPRPLIDLLWFFSGLTIGVAIGRWAEHLIESRNRS